MKKINYAKFFGILFGAGLLTLCVSTSQIQAQTINIGPNQYAFRFTVNPNYGLFFNATNTAYDFRNGLGNSVFSINADNGQIRNDLQFAPGFTHRVPAGNWAIRSATAPNAGIFFGAADFEFRIASGAPGWLMNAVTGNSTFIGTVSAPGGNSTLWNQAVAWGNHASAGYITSESDPKIGALSTSSVPRWNGTQLVNSAITAGASTATVSGTPGTVAIVGAPSGSLMILENPGGAPLFQTNESRLSFSKANSQIAQLGTSDSDFIIRMGSTERFRMNPDGNAGFGATPEAGSTILAEKTILGTSGGAIHGTVSYVGNSDVRGVRGTSVTNPGYGIGVNGTGGYMGVRGEATATDYTGTAYAVYGSATGTAGTRIGVYGTATGGDNNWAGYFASGNTYVSGDLRVGSTTGATGYKVSVNGKIMCTEMRVLAFANWPDYVFGDSHKRLTLDELDTFVKTEKHLPGVPSAAEMEAAQGFEVGEMQKITIEKVEELTLYILEQHTQMKAQDAQLEKQAAEIEALKALVQKLIND
jgi:hypothetical protein